MADRRENEHQHEDRGRAYFGPDAEPGGDRPVAPWWRFLQPGRFRAWCAYHHALDDVWDLALEDFNPCHDKVRAWIATRRKEVPRV